MGVGSGEWGVGSGERGDGSGEAEVGKRKWGVGGGGSPYLVYTKPPLPNTHTHAGGCVPAIRLW